MCDCVAEVVTYCLSNLETDQRQSEAAFVNGSLFLKIIAHKQIKVHRITKKKTIKLPMIPRERKTTTNFSFIAPSSEEKKKTTNNEPNFGQTRIIHEACFQ